MLCSFSKDFSSSSYTNVENAFIKEYMPLSTGDAVKVYLYGLMLCNHPELDVNLSDFASNISMSEEKVREYFAFWEEFGILSIVSNEPFAVSYLPSYSGAYSKPRKFKLDKYSDFTKSLQSMITSRMISTGEYSEYFNIMETYSIKPDAMLMIVRYCIDRQDENIGYRYISKVAKDFGNRGINTVAKVENELSSYISRTGDLKKILNALSSKRQPDIDDLNLYKKWTEELNFELTNIIFAAKISKKSSMAKLDEFLLELYSMKSFSKEEIAEYMSNRRFVYELAIKINKALALYIDVIDTEVDSFIKKWISYGFSDKALLLIASHLFKTGKNTLQYMDELVENLRNKGCVDYVSIGDYFENEKKTDEFLLKMLATCGISRRPTDWDRNNLSVWRTWNFSDEMILEAAKLASGKSSPVAYMNAVLSSWKNKNIFTVADTADYNLSNDSQEAYNREYSLRRSIAIERAQKNSEKAMEIEGFSKIYERLFSIEKDLAFAEISADNERLNSLENEKTQLTEKANNLLSKINLNLDDLSPKYACPKCNDTGYVGTHRCDCFDKKVNID